MKSRLVTVILAIALSLGFESAMADDKRDSDRKLSQEKYQTCPVKISKKKVEKRKKKSRKKMRWSYCKTTS